MRRKLEIKYTRKKATLSDKRRQKKSTFSTPSDVLRHPKEKGTGKRGHSHPLADKVLSGAETIIQVLVDEGVDTIFGYSGGAILPTYDAIFRHNKDLEKEKDGQIRLIVPANEQGAGFMAAGYARASGKVGCFLVTSGPGATKYRDADPGLYGRLDSGGFDLRAGSAHGSRYRRFPGSSGFQYHERVRQACFYGPGTRRSWRRLFELRLILREAAAPVRW